MEESPVLAAQDSLTAPPTMGLCQTKSQYDYLNRLSSITNTPAAAGAPVIGFAYQHNTANQRTALTNADGSYWAYQYDSLGQVISGKKYWPDGTAVAGQQFEYTFDDIGNRKTAGTDGDQNGNNLRYQNYTANDLNQYTSRTVPGYVQSLGTAATNARVLLWGDSNHYTVDYRRGSYFWGELWYDNSGGPLWVNLTNFAAVAGGTNADIVASTSGHIFLPSSTEQFSYDADGNLTSDARWNYTWDAENRLITMAARTSVDPQISLAFDYDAQGRRIRKRVWSNTTWSGSPTNDLRFVYDGWNLVAELDGLRTPSFAIRTYLWGTDISGSAQSAAGIGGLLEVTYIGTEPTNCFAVTSGNGDLMGLVNCSDGAPAAQYDYGPFGEPLRSTGPASGFGRIRFAGKYRDEETELSYYGLRYNKSELGRWISRDPFQERGGVNLAVFVSNDPVGKTDAIGLWATPVHHKIVEDWLNDPIYREYPWGCCTIDVVREIERGSDEVDGVLHNGWPWIGWCDAQSSVNSYQHAGLSRRFYFALFRLCRPRKPRKGQQQLTYGHYDPTAPVTGARAWDAERVHRPRRDPGELCRV